MVIDDFCQMPPENQLEFVNASGTWLVGAGSEIFCYHLYWINAGYFVEVSVNVVRHKIQDITAFTHLRYLDKYLDRINIE